MTTTHLSALQHLAQLEDAYRLLDTVLNHVEAHIYMKDAQGRYLYANRNVLELYQTTLDQLLGRRDVELFPAELAEALVRVDAQVFATGQTQQAEEILVDGQGKTQYYWSTKMLLRRPGQPDCLIGFSINVTAHKQAELAMERSEARFRALFELSSEAVMLVSHTQRFLDANPAALKLCGVSSKAELLTLQVRDLSPERQPCGTLSEQMADALIEHTLTQGHHRFEWVVQRRDNGAHTPVEAMVTAVELDDGPAMLIALRDLTERKRYEAQIHRLAYYDALTQLPNRRMLYDRLTQALALHQRNQRHGCIIYLDLDNFKPLNDRHGHVAGDLLLKEVGRRLLACLRGQDTVARLGGDEFVVLLIELDPVWDVAVQQATHVAEKVLTELARPYVLTVEPGPGQGPAKIVEHRCTASLGVTVFRPGESNADNILRRADDAMYRAKAKGSNQIRFVDEGAV